MIYQNIVQMRQVLTNVHQFLVKAETYAEEKGFDVNNLLTARLAPDMFVLTRQVQSCADTAKFAASRLSGKEAPVFEDNESTMEELKARVIKTVAYLETFSEEDFEGGESREVVLRFLPEGAYVLGADYLTQFAQANFYFHVTTTYAILRHNGVPLGKRDFIGMHLAIKMKEA